MLKDLSNQKNIDKEAVLAAVHSIQSKGWDVNAYTVADELRVPRAALYRNTELMDIISQSRAQTGRPNDLASDQILKRSSILEHENQELQEQMQKLEQQNQDIQKREQEAWQAGYKAGWEEAAKYIDQAEQMAIEAQPQKETAENTFDFGSDSQTDISTEPQAAAPVDFNAISHADIHKGSDSHAGSDIYVDTGLEGESHAQTDAAPYKFDDPNSTQEIPAFNSYQFDQFAAHDDHQRPEATGEIDTSIEETTAELAPDYGVADNEQAGAGATDNAEKQKEQEQLEDLVKRRLSQTQQGKAQDKGLMGSKFASAGRKDSDTGQHSFVIRTVPPDIRKACLMLGVRPEELSYEKVHQAWKTEMTRPGTHPDVGGDTEMAVYLNTAKDVLFRWLETQTPKLAKKFGKESGKFPAMKPEDTEPSDTE